MNILKWISMITWELPQTLVGALMWLFFTVTQKASKYYISDQRFITMMTFTSWNHSSDSMGHFIFFNTENYNSYIDLHEAGHSQQSYILGPLYIPLVVIVSLYGWILCKAGIRSWNDYYKHYPENWANKLGGI